jgi:hypothetical protein
MMPQARDIDNKRKKEYTRFVKFKIENTLESPLENVETAMFSDDYYEYLKKNHSGVDAIEVIEQKIEGDTIRRIIKYTPKPIIEKVGPKKVPKDALVFTEYSTYDRKRHALDFENVPRMNFVQQRLSNKGVISLERNGTSTRRTIEGELTVKFPILGAIAERIIFSQARKLLEEEVECFKRYIRLAGK